MSKKKDEPEELTPEDISQCPTTPEEEQLLESALADDVEKPNPSQRAKDEQQTTRKKRASQVQKPSLDERNPIDDMIGAIHRPVQEPVLDIPAELRAPKKIWTPEQKQKTTQTPLYDVSPATGETTTPGTLPSPAGQQYADPPGTVQKPFNQYDKKPYIFDSTAWKHDLVDGKAAEHCYYNRLFVFASAVQKSHALVGIEKIDPQTLYLWFDCFNGHSVNSTKHSVRMYLIKDYYEFSSKIIKPHNLLIIPENNAHLLWTDADAPQIEDFEFLNLHMPIKDSD